MDDAREARRKRLAERKTDRLAFITGHGRSAALPDPQPFTSTESMTLFQTPKRSHNEEEMVINELDYNTKQESYSERGSKRFHNHEIESEVPQFQENFVPREQKEEDASNAQDRTNNEDNISGKLFTTSMLQKPAGQDGPRPTKGSPILSIFTHRAIERSVLATENFRLVVTLVVALLVVLSYKGLIIGHTLLSSIITFRPLPFVLLTDVTIILGSVFLNRGINRRPVKDEKKIAEEGDEGWPNDLSRIFEIGQMLYKVLGAAFMDCSICAVILICGIVA